MSNELIIKGPYEYRLTYVDGDKERTHIFSALVDIEEMKQNLRHFLLACEWSEAGVNKILRLDDNE
jgi:hypothetical protein